MKGAILSVTCIRRFIPPIRISAEKTASIAPVAHKGIPKAVLQVALMEFTWTMHPTHPSARMIATAKNPARKTPSLPGKALRM